VGGGGRARVESKRRYSGGIGEIYGRYTGDIRDI
jgi:hypothetical protein